MAEFDYKQRPFSKKLTDAQYDAAVGRYLEPASKDRWTGQPKLRDCIVEAPCDCAKPCGYRHWKRADAK